MTVLQAPPPAKRPRTEPPSTAALAPPPPLIPALVNSASTAVVDIPTSKSSGVDPVTSVAASLPQALPTIRSPTSGTAAPSTGAVDVSAKADTAAAAKLKPKEEENMEIEGNASTQDDFVNMLSNPGSKGLDPKIDDTECHRSANAM